MVLFILAIFLILLPSVERELLEGKKETTQELTRAAVSILNEYYAEETAGRLTRQQAQEEAAARIELLRYGDESKDYFWITDMHPTMVMHPYLPELNGQDLTDYEDQRGKTLFVAFVDAVRRDGSGFVDYYWQWKDDPERIVPKLSYVQLFEPWQWVIGTGIYVEDVNAAIASFQRYLTYVALAIIAAVALLLLYGARQSLKIERRRAAAEQGLKESSDKYQALVAAATEGILMTLDGKCAYANKPLQDMLGYDAPEMADMILSLLLLNKTKADQQALSYIQTLAATGLSTPAEQLPPANFEARFKAKNGRAVDVLLTATPISLAGKSGVILIVRSIGRTESHGDCPRRDPPPLQDHDRRSQLGSVQKHLGPQGDPPRGQPGHAQHPADTAHRRYRHAQTGSIGSSTPTSDTHSSTASTRTRWSKTIGWASGARTEDAPTCRSSQCWWSTRTAVRSSAMA